MPVSRPITSRSYPKTNSLGSAKADCHTCLRLQKRCDRQRPQCTTCIRDGRACGGYVLEIVWKDQKATTKPTTLASHDLHLETNAFYSGRRGGQQFKFVPGGPKRKRKTKSHHLDGEERLTAVAETTHSPEMNVYGLSGNGRIPSIHSDSQTTDSPLGTDSCMENSGGEYDFSAVPVRRFDHSSEETRTPLTVGDSVEADWNWSLSPDDSLDSQPEFLTDSFELPQQSIETDWMDDSASSMTLIPFSTSTSFDTNALPNYFPLFSGVKFGNRAHQVEAILDMYDQEFCVVPLTADCRSNPFRIPRGNYEASDFLLHAVLAISSQHLAKKNKSAILAAETEDHQAKALRLFGQALGHTEASKLLDALLLLINFEATQTASSTWAVHLSGAQKILEAIGIDACENSQRLRAQIAMLVWWDVTIAFISRKLPRLPSTYLEILMKHDLEDGWTFFTLNGCPVEFVSAMARLAKLSSIYERTLTMEWTIFNMLPIEEIVAEVENWKNDEDATASEIGQTEDDPDARRNKYHCIEAWRHAILIYIYRVFHRKQNSSSLRSISHLARVILDHVRCIPNTAIVQKQTLLPVFLAASEVGDEESRSFVCQYCNHWSLTVRYNMFTTVATLLERIWADWDVSTRDVYWWGVKVGGEGFSQTDRGQILVSELLLG